MRKSFHRWSEHSRPSVAVAVATASVVAAVVAVVVAEAASVVVDVAVVDAVAASAVVDAEEVDAEDEASDPTLRSFEKLVPVVTVAVVAVVVPSRKRL